MLDSLKEIECAYSLLRSSTGGAEKDPIDSHYESLKTKIEPVDQKSEEWDLINQYTKNTHGKTHMSYDLDVEDVRLIFLLWCEFTISPVVTIVENLIVGRMPVKGLCAGPYNFLNCLSSLNHLIFSPDSSEGLL